MCFECTFEQHLIKKRKINQQFASPVLFSHIPAAWALCPEWSKPGSTATSDVFVLVFSPRGVVFFLLSKARALPHIKKQPLPYETLRCCLWNASVWQSNTQTSHRLVLQMSHSINTAVKHCSRVQQELISARNTADLLLINSRFMEQKLRWAKHRSTANTRTWCETQRRCSFI